MTEPTIARALDQAARTLRLAGIERPRAEARLLLQHVSGLNPERQLLDKDRLLVDQAALDKAVEARASRMPLAYITGRAPFWDFELDITPDVLVPRPETETIVEAALAYAREHEPPHRILDIATGSGCLLTALLRSFPEALGIGTDRSPGALHCAGRNLERLGLSSRGLLFRGHWAAAMGKTFDLVVCNPPYLSTSDMASRQAEVEKEPAMALDGGADGLEAYRALAAGLLRLCHARTLMLFEVGWGQAGAVGEIFRDSGFEWAACHRDLAGIARVVALKVRQHHQTPACQGPPERVV